LDDVAGNVAARPWDLADFYGLSVSVSGGSGGYGGDGDEGSEPRCRRCPVLLPNTAYVAFIAVEDDNGATAYHRVNNLAPAPTLLRLRTPDAAPPEWAAGAPAVSAVRPTAATVRVALTEPGTAYFAVRSDRYCPPRHPMQF